MTAGVLGVGGIKIPGICIRISSSLHSFSTYQTMAEGEMFREIPGIRWLEYVFPTIEGQVAEFYNGRTGSGWRPWSSLPGSRPWQCRSIRLSLEEWQPCR